MKRVDLCWPPVTCTLCYYAVLCVLLKLGTQHTQGEIIYPLDDTYIHMAVAKNFVEHHVWGITQYAFSSSTTSPLWTALLAVGYLLWGPNQLLPLILNTIIGTILIFCLFGLFRSNLGPQAAFVVLITVLSVTSVPALTLTGMEHLLHILTTIIFVHLSVGVITQVEESRTQRRSLLLVASLLPLIRYEGVFGIATVCLFFCLQRRFRYAFALGAVAAMPLLLYGAVSIFHGWLPIPNSVLMKLRRLELFWTHWA